MNIFYINRFSTKCIFILFALLLSLLVFSTSIFFKITGEYKSIENNWMPSVSITKEIKDSLIYLKYSQDLYLLTKDDKYINLLNYRKERIDKLLFDYKNLISSESERIIYDDFKKLYIYFISCKIDFKDNCDNRDSEDLVFYHAVDEIKNLIKINVDQMNFELSRSNDTIYKYEVILIFSIISFTIIIFTFFLFVVVEKLKRKNTIPNRIVSGLDSCFKLVYQPIVEIDSNKVIGVEVLSRFEDKHGVITPDVFIPMIKSLGLSWEFSKRVIKSSVNELSALKEVYSDFKISINIFPTDLENNILDVLNMNVVGSITHNIVFEITEFEGCDNKKVQENIKKLKELGYRFSIDDFGTGYSNFNTLKDFDIDTLKVDRSLLFDIADEPVKVVLLENICKMAQTLSLSVIAEGIENLSQHNIISDTGVRYGQGWLYGKPVDIFYLSEILVRENSINSLNMLKEC